MTTEGQTMNKVIHITGHGELQVFADESLARLHSRGEQAQRWAWIHQWRSCCWVRRRPSNDGGWLQGYRMTDLFTDAHPERWALGKLLIAAWPLKLRWISISRFQPLPALKWRVRN